DEAPVGTHPNAEVQIARRSAPATRFPFLAQPNPVARVDAFGNAHRDAPALLGDAYAAAAGTRRFGKLPFPQAAAARRRGDELPEGRLPGVAHLAGAAAFGARHDGRARLGLVAVAARARLRPRHFVRLFGTEHGFLEVDGDLHLQIAASHRSAPPLTRPAAHE